MLVHNVENALKIKYIRTGMCHKFGLMNPYECRFSLVQMKQKH